MSVTLIQKARTTPYRISSGTLVFCIKTPSTVRLSLYVTLHGSRAGQTVTIVNTSPPEARVTVQVKNAPYSVESFPTINATVNTNGSSSFVWGSNYWVQQTGAITRPLSLPGGLEGSSVIDPMFVTITTAPILVQYLLSGIYDLKGIVTDPVNNIVCKSTTSASLQTNTTKFESAGFITFSPPYVIQRYINFEPETNVPPVGGSDIICELQSFSDGSIQYLAGKIGYYLGGINLSLFGSVPLTQKNPMATSTSIYIFNGSSTSYKALEVISIGYGTSEAITNVTAYQETFTFPTDPTVPGVLACVNITEDIIGDAFCGFMLPCLVTLQDMTDASVNVKCTCYITTPTGANGTPVNNIYVYLGFIPNYFL
jgi:hypothetical protein